MKLKIKIKIVNFLFSSLLLSSTIGLVACSKPNPICQSKNATGDLNGVEFQLEVACSNEERNQGLMFRKSLGKDSGMIFVFDSPNYYSFWMKNTYIPLSIAFLDENKIIVDIQNMKPHDETPVVTKTKALYAVEMNLHWFEDNKINVGDKFRIKN